MITLAVLAGSAALPWATPAPPPWSLHVASPTALGPPGNLTPSQNVSSTVPGPDGTLLPGDRIGFRYEISIRGYNPSWGTVTVWMPPTQANFITIRTVIPVPLGARNLSIANGSFTASNATSVLDPLTNITELRSGAGVTFGTEEAAPMAIFPFGSIRVLVRWQWIVLRGDGALTNSSWSPEDGAAVVPAEFVQLVSLGPRQVAPGGNETACLSGPIGGRVFALHLLTLNPPDDFAQAGSTIPFEYGSEFCLNVTVPSYVLPETASVRVWNLVAPNSTLLLFSMHIHIQNQTSTTAPATVDWTTVGNGAAVGLAAAVASAILIVRHRGRPRTPRDATSPAP
jgi:hypothetical protein